MKNWFSWRNLSLLFAAILLLLVCLLMAFALFDAKYLCVEWRDVVSRLQTFFGGLSVLAASLFAYHATTAMAEESRRKDELDRKAKKENENRKLAFSLHMIRQQSHARLMDFNGFQKFEKETVHIIVYERLSLYMPPQLMQAWDNLSLFAEDVCRDLSDLTNFIQMYIAEHELGISSFKESITKLDQNKTVEKMQNVKKYIDFLNDKGMNENEKKDFEETTKKFNEYKHTFHNPHYIPYKRAVFLLKEINRLAIAMMKLMPITKNGNLDSPIYPSSYEKKAWPKKP